MGLKKAGVERRERRLQAVGLLTLGERGRRQDKTQEFKAHVTRGTVESEGSKGMSGEKYWRDDNCVPAERPGLQIGSNES